jgi:hypothetical protein
MAAAGLAAVAIHAPSALASTCGAGMYAYAGMWSKSSVRGVTATIAPAAASVRDGHVAGWVGVASEDAGPDQTGSWIQVGVSAFPGDATGRVYYEVTRPGVGTRYRELRARFSAARPHRFTIVELARRPNWWQASVDGVPVGRPTFMPGSDRGWRAQVVGESWAGTSSGSCNDYAYSFSSVALLGVRTGRWAPPLRVDAFQDPGYVLMRNSSASFVAASSAFARR